MQPQQQCISEVSLFILPRGCWANELGADSDSFWGMGNSGAPLTKNTLSF